MAVRLRNSDVAGLFERLADLLDIEGESPFRVRAYRNAAETIAGLGVALDDLIAQGADLTRYPHIGREIADKIHTIAESGHLPALDEVAGRVPPELADLMAVQGLGPKSIKAVFEAFAVRSLDEVEQLARAGRLRELAGFGAKKEASVLQGIERLRAQSQQRSRLDSARDLAQPLAERLSRVAGVDAVTIAGSYRRRRGTVGDLDLLVACRDGEAAMGALADHGSVDEVLSRGATRSSMRLAGGLQVDVRAVDPAHWGAAMLYFTGSQAHNVRLRQRALDRGYKLNEYALWAGETIAASATEAAIYRELGLDWIAPELREDQGEIEAAERGALPELVETEQLQGNLHAHTTYSDGQASLEAMAEAAHTRGDAYLAITDHGPKVRVAGGLSPERLAEQGRAIDALNRAGTGVTLLKGCEVDILADGSLDLPDESLAPLDIVVCSIHYNLRLSRDEQTQRVLTAMDNPYFMIWGHPTAREINRREPIDIDLDTCLEAAAARGIAVEINAQPKRLDLCDAHIRRALAKGCRLVVNTDAHSVANLDLQPYGVAQARRGWTEAGTVLNTRSLGDLLGALR
jgi:DNA polymerase (family 10)